MKIVGIIAEYNPFHNGHKYHIEKARELTGADYVVVVMSGNYVQRGMPAIMPKHLRTQIALNAGADVVLELPVYYSLGSAEYFSFGAIRLLDQLGCVDSICYGCECGSVAQLSSIAEVLLEEPETYKTLLRKRLREGDSFPLAREKALISYFNAEDMTTILSQPNNILGIEYMKALMQTGSKMKPYAIKRKDSSYHDEQLSETYSSASAIRKLLAYSSSSFLTKDTTTYDAPYFSDVLEQLNGQVPDICIKLLSDTHHTRFPVYMNDYSLLLKYVLLNESKNSLVDYVDISPELANRIMNQLNRFMNFEQFCDLLKTKELTYSRISRALFHVLLGIKRIPFASAMAHDYHAYAHLLGFRNDSIPVLTEIKANASIPMLTKLTDTDQIPDWALNMLKVDIHGSNLYESIITEKYKHPFINEYEHQVIKI